MNAFFYALPKIIGSAHPFYFTIRILSTPNGILICFSSKISGVPSFQHVRIANAQGPTALSPTLQWCGPNKLRKLEYTTIQISFLPVFKSLVISVFSVSVIFFVLPFMVISAIWNLPTSAIALSPFPSYSYSPFKVIVPLKNGYPFL